MADRTFFWVLSFLMLSLSSCLSPEGENNNDDSNLPGNTGAPGEVLVVMEQGHWENEPGKSIRQVLGKPYPRLPQEEPLYTLVYTGPQGFTSTLEKHRNIILARIGGDREEKASLRLARNVWAKDQLVIEMEGKDPEQLGKAFHDKEEAILDQLEELEKTQEVNDLQKISDEKVIRKMKEDHQVSLLIPKDSEVQKNKDRFCWIERHYMKSTGQFRHDITQGLFIYHYPYEKKGSFSGKELLRVRDSLLKEHVPGPSPGSYMTTEDRFEAVKPLVKETTHRGEYAVEIRGLWRVENDQMGGPFISLTTYDKARGRIVTVEGYVFAPKFDKREYVRELETILYSLDFPSPG